MSNNIINYFYFKIIICKWMMIANSAYNAAAASGRSIAVVHCVLQYIGWEILIIMLSLVFFPVYSKLFVGIKLRECISAKQLINLSNWSRSVANVREKGTLFILVVQLLML